MKIKTIVSALLATALTAALAVPAFAAGSINAAEDRILDALDTEINGVRVLDTVTGSDFYYEVEYVLLWDQVDLNDTEANIVVENIWEAKALVEEAGYTSVEEIEADVDLYNTLGNLIVDTGAAVGITLVEDENGDLWYEYDNSELPTRTGGGSSSTSAVKQTGVDFTATWAVLALVVAATAGCAVFVKKNSVEA